MAGPKKSSKAGRNKKACEMYRLSDRREHNKARKLVRHLKRFPGDRGAFSALKALPVSCAKKAGVSAAVLNGDSWPATDAP